MNKKDVLQILTQAEAARAIKRHQAQINRMPDIVPEQYKDLLILACRGKTKKNIKALRRLEDALKRRI